VLPASLHAAKPEDKGLKPLQDQLLAHITVLAGDDYAGREPGTEGESKTLRYIARQLFDMGVVSGTNQPARPWFAPVRLLGREPAGSVAQFFRRGRPVPVAPGEALMLTSGRRSLVQGAPLFFVGQGTSVPPRAELAGRVAVLLDGDTAGEGDFGAGSEARQNALLAGGAAAVITVLDGRRDMAGVAEHRRRPSYAVASEALGGDLEGFLSAAAFERLLASGPETLPACGPRRRGPISWPPAGSYRQPRSHHARNLDPHAQSIGKIPGRRPDKGAVLLLAHWDHFGSSCAAGHAPAAYHLQRRDRQCQRRGRAAGGDAAAGASAAADGPRRVYPGHHRRGTGAAGRGSLCREPSLPLSRIVAAFNLDSIAIAPAGTPVAWWGRGLPA
jgi:hypothetical protein